MSKNCVLWGLVLVLVLSCSAVFAEEADPAKNEDLEKFNNLVLEHNKKRKVGEVAEYSMEANMGGMAMTGKTVTEIKEVKEDGSMVISMTQTINMMGQEQTQTNEVTVPNNDQLAPNSKFEFSTGDVEANGTTYKNCDIVTITSEMDGPTGPVTMVMTMCFATKEEDGGMVKMEQTFGEQGSMVMVLTKAYAKPE